MDLSPSRESRGRVQILDALRGIAALSVTWFHLATVALFTTRGSLLFRSGSYGWIGVYPFFVISGFVIPLSLAASGYRVRDYGRFILKRIVRLDPPYIVSILVYLALAAYYARQTGTAFRYSTVQILLHLGYLNLFSHYAWISAVYWTLAVEVQYYLLVGLAFPLILLPRRFWLLAAPICLAAAFGLRNHAYIFQYLPYFLSGIAAFHYRRREIGAGAFAAIAVAMGIAGYLIMGGSPALAGLLTSLAIGFLDGAPRPLVFLGSISYSLYLIHGPVGITIGSIVARRIPGIPELAVVLIALAGSLAAAWVLYRLVELPSRSFAARIRYSPDGPGRRPVTSFN
jgi:peptidoglycan/LPS O-acetylase OafA/YrhL